jgi:hypothetical protein
VDFSKAQEQNSISFPVKFSTKKIVEKLTEKHLQEVAGKDDSTFFSESTSLMETKKSNIRIQKMH